MRNINLLLSSLLMACGGCFQAAAQTNSSLESAALSTDNNVQSGQTVGQPEQATDSLRTVAEKNTEGFLPSPIPMSGTTPMFHMYGILPYTHYGYANWDLHQGFNASFGMNITVGLDSKSPSGVGFGQDAAFLYAVPLNNRLSVAGGVYASNMNWGNYNYRNVGITGIAAFKVTDRVTLYGYGNKSIMPKRTFPAYPLPNFSPDKFGGMVNFKLGESASISFGVEAIKNDYPYYW